MDRSEVKMYSICQIYEDPSSLITRKKYLCPHQPPDSSIVQYTDTLKSLLVPQFHFLSRGRLSFSVVYWRVEGARRPQSGSDPMLPDIHS